MLLSSKHCLFSLSNWQYYMPMHFNSRELCSRSRGTRDKLLLKKSFVSGPAETSLGQRLPYFIGYTSQQEMKVQAGILLVVGLDLYN
jgi:hypothetical protein